MFWILLLVSSSILALRCTFFLFLKCLLTSRLTLFRISTLLRFGPYVHCIVAREILKMANFRVRRSKRGYVARVWWMKYAWAVAIDKPERERLRYTGKLECNVSVKVTIYVIVLISFSCMQLTQDRPRGSYERVNEPFFCRGDSCHEFCLTICSFLYFNKCICWAVYWIYKNEWCEQDKIRKYSTSKSGLQLKEHKDNMD